MTGPARPDDWPLGRAVVWLVLGWAALAAPWLSGRVTIPWDAKAHFQPQLQFLADSLHRGESPFWNPFIFGGSPHVADPQSLIFSPAHLAMAAVTPAPGLVAADAVVLGVLLLGGLGILLLFRDRGWHPAGALVAALTFAFGASAAWRIQHTGQILSLGWFPVALWALERALARRTAAWGALAGVAAGFMVINRDQVAMLGAYVLAGRVAVDLLSGPDVGGRLLGSLRALGAATVAGLAVTAVPLILTMLLSEQVSRAAVIDLAGAERGSLHPASLLTAFVANLYGTDGPLELFWGQPSPAWGPVDLFLARNMSNVYMGALPIVALLVLGVARGAMAAREIRFILVAFLLLLAYALGRYTPAFAAMFHLPGVGLWRRPADATFLLGALGAILAGYCIHRHVTRSLPVWTGVRLALALGLLAAGLAAALAVAIWKQRLGQATTPLLTAAAFATGAIAVLWAAPRVAAGRPWWAAALLAAFCAFDLGWNNGPNESTALPPRTYDVLRADSSNPTIAAIRARLAAVAAPDRRDRVELAGIDFHWPNASMVHRLDHTLGYNPVHLDAYTRATGAQDHVALPSQRTFSPLFPSYRSLLADMLGLRLIATRVPVEQMDPALKPGDLVQLGRTEDAFLYENPRALPRVLLVPRAAGADFEAIIASGRWPAGFDPRQTVLLEGMPGLGTGSGADIGGSATIERYANTEVVVRVAAPAGGWLVLNDVWHPWWTADVDGTPTRILRANVLFRAVAVPPGSHTVTFAFRPVRGALRQIAGRAGFAGTMP